MRIQRAQEYGAFWAKAWGDNVTHAIVDNDVTFQHLLSYLGLDSLPVSEPILVPVSAKYSRPMLCASMNVIHLNVSNSDLY